MKSVLITGGANGIGRQAAEKLSSRGLEVNVFDCDAESLQELDGSIETFEGDVRNEERVAEVLDQLDVNCLVNCAGYYELGALGDMKSGVAEEIIDTNVHGYLNFIRHALPQVRRNQGRIVNVSSVAGRVAAPYFGVYSASKHAVEALSDSLRLEEAEHGVDVAVVEPGPVDTGFNRRAREALEKYLPGSVFADRYREVLESDGMNGVEPEKAGEKLVEAVVADSPRARYRIRFRDTLALKLKQVLPTAVWDRIVRRAFY